MGNLMDDAKIVPMSPAPAPAVVSDPDAGATLLTDRTKSKRTLSVLLFVAVPIVLIVGVGIAYRLFGDDASAAASAAPQADVRPEALGAPTAVPASVAACQGDLSQVDAQRKWYCQSFMPWKQAVDAKLALLEGRGGGSGVPTGLWILIAVLGANGVVTWIMLLRRRKTSL